MARRHGNSSPQRLTQWVRTDAGSGGTGYKSLAVGSAVIDQSLPFTTAATIIRTRGSVSTVSDQVAANEAPFGAYGICVVSNQAFAIGITAIPTPYTDADSDLWFVHGYWYCPFAFGSAVGFNNVSQRTDFDSKVMRRISEDETVVMVMENGDATGGISYRFDFATLIKLG